jgi:CheY-like chemotaxis protein
VDNNTDFLSGLKRLLEQNGMDVLTAQDGLHALKLLGEQGTLPDVIISDINMPRMGGYQFFMTLSNNPQWSHIPFIFLTDLSSPQEIQHAKMLGVDDYLVKPFENEDLIAIIRGKITRYSKLSHITKKFQRLFSYMALEKSAPSSKEENSPDLKNMLTLLHVEWNDKLGPYLKVCFPDNPDLAISVENLGFQLFNGVASVYGMGELREAQGILINIENIRRAGYLFYDSKTDEKARGQWRPYMLGIIAPKIDYLISFQIKKILQDVSSKIKTGMDWNIVHTWETITNLLLTSPFVNEL